MKDEKWKSFTETMDVRALKNVTPLSMSWPIAMGKHCDLHRVEEGIVGTRSFILCRRKPGSLTPGIGHGWAR
jgi:hypothetical protein